MAHRPMPLEKVVNGGLCSGCGVCAYLQSAEISMEDVPSAGLRPVPKQPDADKLPNGEGALACPGSELTIDPSEFDEATISELRAGWGPIRQLWEGSATDSELRHSGSSGGAASALALHALDAGGYHGVVHVTAQDAAPHLNQTVVSRSRSELLRRTGSRYAPASPCDGLAEVEEGPGPFLFIGKPCDVAATRKARKLRPALDENLGITIAFFCAGTPSTQGTLEMLREMGIDDPAHVSSLRYRGNGWPGHATAVYTNDSGEEAVAELTYEESWGGVLSKHVQWRCRLCADHTGEFADVAVGDPWYREVQEGEAGSSLILARTERGRRFIEGAIESGHLTARPAEADLLPRSQHNLLKARGSVWGRRLGLLLIGARRPTYNGIEQFQFWKTELSMKEKFVSVLGTIRRCLSRGFHPLARK